MSPKQRTYKSEVAAKKPASTLRWALKKRRAEPVAQPATSCIREVGRFFVLDKGKGGEKQMRKRITLLVAALMMALTMSFSGVAFAAIDEGPGRGNPDTTPSGKCPPGQNKDTSVGGLKKCER